MPAKAVMLTSQERADLREFLKVAQQSLLDLARGKGTDSPLKTVLQDYASCAADLRHKLKEQKS